MDTFLDTYDMTTGIYCFFCFLRREVLGAAYGMYVGAFTQA